MKTILWTDEAIYTRDGVFNCHNSHCYDIQNPHLGLVNKSQHRFQIMVWGGIMDKTIIGPYFMRENLTGERYLQFLEEELPELLNVIPVERQRNMIFMQDGVRNWLDRNYPRCWIGRLGPIAWPPRSPDLTPMDFFLWGASKEIVYKERIESLEQLMQRIQESFDQIRNKMQNINIIGGITRRLQECINQNGNHVENHL